MTTWAFIFILCCGAGVGLGLFILAEGARREAAAHWSGLRVRGRLFGRRRAVFKLWIRERVRLLAGKFCSCLGSLPGQVKKWIGRSPREASVRRSINNTGLRHLARGSCIFFGDNVVSDGGREALSRRRSPEQIEAEWREWKCN